MYNKVEICGVNTSKLKVISEEKKRELLIKARDGDKLAREELINGNLKLVLSVIQSFGSRVADLDDLFQVGVIGLIKSVDNFDVNLDVRFSTYAVPMIIGEIRRYLRDDSQIRVSRSLKELAYKALKTKEQLALKYNREPSVKEISTHLGVEECEVNKALDAISAPISLFEPIYNENGDSVYVFDQISDKVNTDEKWITNIAISEAIKKLGERERKILLLRYYTCKTQTEVSEEIGISQAQVSRLEKNALDKLRQEL